MAVASAVAATCATCRRPGVDAGSESEIKSLDERDRDDGWRELAVEDRRCGPAPNRPLSHRLRRLDGLCYQSGTIEIAEALAAGHETQLVARMFGLSSGRVSQLRKVLHAAWCRFQGQTNGAQRPSAARALPPASL